MNRGLGPPIRVLHIGRYGGVAGSATVEENSTIPPSPRVVKGLERVAVAIAIKGSRIARSRPTAARMRGRSKAKRLERATREPHNRLRRPIEVDTDSLLDTGYIPRGSLGWFVQLRQRQRGVSDHICGRGRDRRLGQISWSLTPRLPSVSRARQPCAYRAAEGAARILRSETTGPAGVTALKRCRTDFGIGHPDRQGRFQEGEHPAQRPVPPFVPLSA